MCIYAPYVVFMFMICTISTMEPPKFTIDSIKYADSPAMFARAEALFKTGKVGAVREDRGGYSATVAGTKSYEVSVSRKAIDVGYCTCYMGEHDQLCKHMLALALVVLDMTVGLEQKDTPTTFAEVKKKVSLGMRKLVPYGGPSKIWFTYQRKLSIGSGMIEDAVSRLAPTREHADYLWGLVIRISNKLATSGIDDSDGTVGNCVHAIIERLGQYAKDDPALKPRIIEYCKAETGFGFEDELLDLLGETDKKN